MLALAPPKNHQAAADCRGEELMPGELNDHFTPADRRELIETGVNLKNLVGDFADLKKSLEDSRKKTDADDDAMDKRVRALENFRWWIVGAAAGSGGFFGFLGSHFFKP